jgi:(p)ppGpp synthase/HD superfamily hydrolase
MHSFAQTNLQLFNQLSELNYADDDIRLADQAYRIAVCLFPGAFRPSGKPFLSHLIGTASILAWLRSPIRIIITGLLHAAYSHGEFGSGWVGVSDTKREQMREAIGAEVEELISAYTNFKWNSGTISTLRERFESLSFTDRQVLLVRLANELEDHLDLGVSYCEDFERRLHYIRSSLFLCVDLAAKLGCSELAKALERQINDILEASIRPAVHTDHKESYRVMPFTRSAWRNSRLLYIAAQRFNFRRSLIGHWTV